MDCSGVRRDWYCDGIGSAEVSEVAGESIDGVRKGECGFGVYGNQGLPGEIAGITHGVGCWTRKLEECQGVVVVGSQTLRSLV